MHFDPWNPAFVAHPYDVYRELRDRAPVSYFEPTGQWLVARHGDVNAALRDRRLGRSYLHVASHEEFGREPEPGFQEPFWRVIRAGMLDVEPPVHTRLRRLVSKAFTPRMVEELRPRVRRVARELVAAFVERGGGDLIGEVAEPLPVTVIAEMLGVPESDRHLLRPWSADICGMYELNPSTEVQHTAVRAASEFSDYLSGLAAARRADPGDDLISALAQVADEGDTLTEEELIGTCVLLLNAGHEATVNVTANGWWALFRNPAELERLRADPSLLPTAVEELMRYDTPLQMFERWVLQDVTIGGVDIPKGTEVALLFGSANHDPEVFDDPERLDVGRKDNPHISFGAGIHFCLGAPLARVELIESFGALLAAAPGLELAEEPSWKPNFVIRGLESLKVTI
ncbi:cytochrome P450 [Sphaerisporangium siamense]|uniref:Cytochrome P450 n=1 Tax=Sphaerisporangium siamense TaxID=795645 RepID=A0A7W7G8E7_9ACTN|nr:cytochrome P450 [Sphaerisporangium siamense]MBB4700222.1 cytochrome P450 [Sphaerisporangium siamense]GII84465.1 cytochrome P450 [Sphaerisporangium siamense]